MFISINRTGSHALPAAAGPAGTDMACAAAPALSTMDLSAEIADMVAARQAYSAAARIMATADRMLGELVRVHR